MEVDMKESLRTTILTDKENISGRTAKYIKVSGKIIRCTDME
jgi:hypothetical protein